MIRQFELIDMVGAYNPRVDEDLLNRAYVFALRAHGGEKRDSGEDYFNHPVEVAAILTGLKLDDATIAAALLHDTIEDSGVTLDALDAQFGDEVVRLVDGVTKLSKLEVVPKEVAQAENLRRLFTAMARDPRVLLVKMADRLHNMRTIHHINDRTRRERIARETQEIFAPLAGRMGMQWMREELEDRAFEVLAPEARLSVMRRFVHLKHTTGDGLVREIIDAIQRELNEQGLFAEVSGREKRPYGIWRKMQSKGVSFEQLSDIMGFRIIVDSEDDCYRALGIVHRAFHAVPGRFKDFISRPKPNGYQSIHTTVIGPKGARIETQIRTFEMHEVAESGLASHWSYKDGVRRSQGPSDDPFRWLRELIEQSVEAEELIEDAKREMNFDQVFCFTPRGDVIDMPLGATALDFAYAIHTEVGASAIGAKIDGRRAPLSTPLRNGHTVEILQSVGQRPTRISLDMVTTGRARAAIRQTLRAQERLASAELGAKLVQGRFERANAVYSMKAMRIAAARLGFADAEAMLAEIGESRLSAMRPLEVVYPESARALRVAETEDNPAIQTAVSSGDRSKPQVVIAQHDGGPRPDPELVESTPIRSAACCQPLPGHRVVAINERRQGQRLHAIDCATLRRYENAMDSWKDVGWAPSASERARHPTGIFLLLANEPGALGQICSLIGDSGANIADVSIVDRKPDFFRVHVDLEVRDSRHLSNVLRTLNAQPSVATAERRLVSLKVIEAIGGGPALALEFYRPNELEQWPSTPRPDVEPLPTVQAGPVVSEKEFGDEGEPAH